MAAPNQVPKLYKTVVDDVITSVREAFLDEGVDEQILQELRQSWENKMIQSKAVGSVTEEHVLSSPYAVATQSQTIAGKQKVMSNQLTQAISVPIQISRPELSTPAQTAAMALTTGLFQQQLAAGISLQPSANNHYITVTNIPQQAVQSSPQVATATITVPNANTLVHNQVHTTSTVAAPSTQVLHPTVNAPTPTSIIQFDGAADTSSEDEDDYENDENEDEEDEAANEEEVETGGVEEEPLNSEDDVSDGDVTDLFDTDNVVVCQYEKIHRNKNKWKFQLKDGIMNLNGKDSVFQKGVGDAECSFVTTICCNFTAK
ncbi:transcription initiation factor IIA subunit 1-like [Octopus vulgaris]|uniref:Transcription initiation factor IIA subunit 1-like n=1 Tax=Octopus vulgaris TaxID=6645 RepID=A0AA36FA75_OCTVU|nr:transcription initiation factor IIA subunit 1-like [Octopus vulgaris]